MPPPASTEAELLPRVVTALAEIALIGPFMESATSFPWIITHVLLGAVHIVQEPVHEKFPANLTASECRTIGKALSRNLTTSKFGPARAVEKWVSDFPALQTIDTQEKWFRPMMDVLAAELSSRQGSIGARARLLFGAGVSMVDQVSDIAMVRFYALAGRHGTALGLALMVALNYLAQLFLVWGQTRGAPKRKRLFEMLIVVSSLKPGVDAWRVGRGQGKCKHAFCAPEVELASVKCFEMCFESIPGAVLQTYALCTGGGVTRGAMLSIIVSALTTGFASATISRDFDMDGQRRRDEPGFYGLLPRGARGGLAFLCMMGASGTLLLARAFSFTLLALAGLEYLLGYVLLDHALYLGYRALRNDLWHWSPLEGTMNVIMAVLERSVVKVIVDFSGLVQFRAPGEMGGAYYSFNLLTALGTSFLIPHLFFASGGAPGLSPGVIWPLVRGLGAAWAAFAALFCLLAKKRLLPTFFSLETGAEWSRRFFLEGKEDRVRMFVHGQNRLMWLPIREQVKKFTLDNWGRWERERPEWFNEAWKAGVDDDCIPPQFLSRMKGVAGGRNRRRSSLFGGGADIVPR